jgi:midasin (ATPase involved in ribosome maturation)
MSLLQAVERYLGVDTWPSNIITYLFAKTPSSRVVEELTEFFASNGVPETLAYKFYGSCNPEAVTELVRQLFFSRFSLWHSSNTVRRHSVYYDVRIKKHVCLNVPYFTELLAIRENPVAVPGWHAPKLGIANTATPTMINSALQLVSQKQL